MREDLQVERRLTARHLVPALSAESCIDGVQLTVPEGDHVLAPSRPPGPVPIAAGRGIREATSIHGPHPTTTAAST